MVLIFGGAYQGKLDFAKKEYSLNEEDIYYCNNEEAIIDLDKKAIYSFEKYVMACIKNNMKAEDIIPSLEEKIVICDDVSSGIVPIDKDQRAMREMVGRAMIVMASRSSKVFRIFCGLAQRLK